MRFNDYHMSAIIRNSYDVGYLLRNSSVAIVNESISDALFRGLKSHISILELIEGSDNVKRQVSTHVQMESEWKEMFVFQIYFQPISPCFIRLLSKDRTLLLNSVNVVCEALFKLHPVVEMKVLEKLVFQHYTCNVCCVAPVISYSNISK